MALKQVFMEITGILVKSLCLQKFQKVEQYLQQYIVVIFLIWKVSKVA